MWTLSLKPEERSCYALHERVGRHCRNGGAQEKITSPNLQANILPKTSLKAELRNTAILEKISPKIRGKNLIVLVTSQKQSYLDKGDVEVEEEDGACMTRRILLVYL